MNEVDMAEFIQQLPEDKLIQAFRLLPKGLASDVFVNMDEDVQKNLITSLTTNEATIIIEDMFTDDATDLFDEKELLLRSVNIIHGNKLKKVFNSPDPGSFYTLFPIWRFRIYGTRIIDRMSFG